MKSKTKSLRGSLSFKILPIKYFNIYSIKENKLSACFINSWIIYIIASSQVYIFRLLSLSKNLSDFNKIDLFKNNL